MKENSKKFSNMSGESGQQLAITSDNQNSVSESISMPSKVKGDSTDMQLDS